MLLFVRAKCSCEPDFKTKNERVKKEVDGEQEMHERFTFTAPPPTPPH